MISGLHGESLSKRIKPSTPRIFTSYQRRTVRKSQGQIYPPVSRELINNIFHRKLSKNVPSNKNISQKGSGKGFLITKRPPISIKSKQDIHSEQQSIMNKYSDRVKLIYNPQLLNGKNNGKFLVISADFIVNQDNFWKQQSINSNIVKQWKILHTNYNVLWTIRRQSNFQKIKNFCSLYDLPLNAVYLIKRKGNYTINYNPILKDIKFWCSQINEHSRSLQQVNIPQRNQKLICIPQTLVIESIKSNLKTTSNFQTYYGKVPIACGRKLKIAFIRLQQNAPGLTNVIKVAKKLLSQTKDEDETSMKHMFLNSDKNIQIPNFIKQHFNQKKYDLQIQKIKSIKSNQNNINVLNENLKNNKNDEKTKNSTQQSDYEQQAVKKVEQFRRELINSIIDTKGKSYKIDGVSVYYYIGDMMKRNHDKLVQRQCQQIQKNNNNKKKQFNYKLNSNVKLLLEESHWKEINQIQFYQFSF